jgi:drug/metabolite transporter (DMT)-like permease
VLFAAFLHASWNIILRNSNDKLLSMSAIALGHVPFGIMGLISFGFPNSESLIYILASAFLHVCYMFFLLNAYRHAELSQVYPIARGLSPLILVLIGTMFLGEYLSKYEIFGILCVSVTLILYGIQIGFKSRANLRGFYYAAWTGCFIAS